MVAKAASCVGVFVFREKPAEDEDLRAVEELAGEEGEMPNERKSGPEPLLPVEIISFLAVGIPQREALQPYCHNF